MSSPSLNGCLYYVLFIDDHSRKSWIYFLKAKSETFDRVKEFKSLIENQTGIHIHILISDNGSETFAPVARYTSIRTILALAAVMKWKIHQMEVKTAFLNGVVEEEVYVEQPLGFETKVARKRAPFPRSRSSLRKEALRELTESALP